MQFWGEYGECTAGMELPPFPIHVSREVDEIAEAIRERLLRWGWEFLLTPRGMKELDERLKAHRSTKKFPLLDAARSWRSARKVRKHLGADALADEAIRLGVPPTMTPEEGERVINDQHREWYESPSLGDDAPSFSTEEHEDLSRSIDVVSAYLRNVVAPHALAETRERLEREVREGSFPATDIGHQPEMEPKETETDEAVESTTRVLALDEDGRGIKCIDLAGVKVWESEWNYPNKLHGYRFNLFLTRCKRWVKGYQTFAFGYEVAPHLKQRGLKYEVLHHEEAVAWFSENNIPHPPELLDAFDRSPSSAGLDASQNDARAGSAVPSSNCLPTAVTVPGTQREGNGGTSFPLIESPDQNYEPNSLAGRQLDHILPPPLIPSARSLIFPAKQPDGQGDYHPPVKNDEANVFQRVPKQAGRHRRNKGGRPADTDANQDRCIAEAWQTRSFESLEDLGHAFQKTKAEVKRALDRHRKRAGKTPSRKRRQEH